MNIVKATIQDKEFLWKLRNEMTSRKMLINDNYISWESHCEWFSKAQMNPNIFILIGKKHNTKVGMVKFEKYQSLINKYCVAINISPKQRRKGFGKLLLIEGIKKLKNLDTNTREIVAEIKKDNKSSYKLFSSSGFVLYDEEKGINTLVYKLDQ